MSAALLIFVAMASSNIPEIQSLILRVKQGSEAAFSEVYDRYCGAIHAAVRQFIKDEDLAQDVLQETFIKVWKNIASYDDTKGSFFTWMLQITRNTSIDALRKLKKEAKSEIQIESAAVGNALKEEQNIHTIGLDHLVAQLPEEQRLMIEYLYYKGFTQQEVADTLELPLGTVKTRSRLAMRELRKWFTLLILWI